MRQIYHHSFKTRAWVSAAVMLFIVGYGASGRFGLIWVGTTRQSATIWISEGSIGYSSDSPGIEKYGPGLAIMPLTSVFDFDWDVDFRDRGGRWFVNVALWPLVLVAIGLLAWVWRWRTLPVGACDGCGYLLDGRSVCSECGRTTKSVHVG